MQGISRFALVAGLAVLLVGLRPASAQAQGGSMKAIFEKHGLLGSFAYDCSKPPSKDNVYFVNRLIDPDHVQRDQMVGPTTRVFFIILDQAKETAPNEVWISGRLTGALGTRNFDGERVDGIWRIEPKRMLQWQSTIGGQKLLEGGRNVYTSRQIPPLNKCGT